MTYCVGIKLESGLVLASDSRTSAGVDDVSVYSKMHTFDIPEERVFILLSAGNLATTQAVRNQIRRDMEDEGGTESLRTVPDLHAAAEYVGRISTSVQQSFTVEGNQRGGFNPEATFILSGQIAGAPADLFLIYPQGNYISASTQQPFLQIGETKYGKPILDRMIRPDTTPDMAARCALVSMDASMRSNLTVGPPVELLIYATDSLRIDHRVCYEPDDDYWIGLQRAWEENLYEAFMKLPRFSWEE